MKIYDRLSLHPLLALAALFIAAALAIGYRKHHFLSGFTASMILILLSIGLIYVPMMSREGRVSQVAPEAVGLMVVFGMGSLAAMVLARDATEQRDMLVLRWRILPRRIWYPLLSTFSFLDPVVTYITHGGFALQLASGGEGGAAQAYYEAFSPLTYMSYAASLAIFIAWMLEWLTDGGSSIRQFAVRNPAETALVAITSALTVLSGSRHQILIRAVVAVTLLVRFRRLRTPLLIVAAVAMTLFVSIIGSLRVGTDVDVTLELIEKYRDVPGASQLSWLVLYSEPNLNNLSLLIDSRPEPQLGLSWATSLAPQAVLDAVGLKRMNASSWMADRQLLAFRGLTLRTFYADLIMDFGVYGAGTIGFFILASYGYISNRALRSGFWLVIFSCLIPCYYSFGGLNGLYQLPTVAVLALPFVFGGGPRARNRRAFRREEGAGLSAGNENLAQPLP